MLYIDKYIDNASVCVEPVFQVLGTAIDKDTPPFVCVSWRCDALCSECLPLYLMVKPAGYRVRARCCGDMFLAECQSTIGEAPFVSVLSSPSGFCHHRSITRDCYSLYWSCRNHSALLKTYTKPLHSEHTIDMH